MAIAPDDARRDAHLYQAMREFVASADDTLPGKFGITREGIVHDMMAPGRPHELTAAQVSRRLEKEMPVPLLGIPVYAVFDPRTGSGAVLCDIHRTPGGPRYATSTGRRTGRAMRPVRTSCTGRTSRSPSGRSRRTVSRVTPDAPALRPAHQGSLTQTAVSPSEWVRHRLGSPRLSTTVRSGPRIKLPASSVPPGRSRRRSSWTMSAVGVNPSKKAMS